MATEGKEYENRIKKYAEGGDYGQLLKLYDEMFPQEDIVPTIPRISIPVVIENKKEELGHDLEDLDEICPQVNDDLVTEVTEISEENDVSGDESSEAGIMTENPTSAADVEENEPITSVTKENDPITEENPLLSLMKKADYMSSYGKCEEAVKIYNTLIAMKTSEEGEDSRTVLTMKQKIGGILHSLRKNEEALKILNVVLKKQIEILGDDKDSTKPDKYETKLIIANVLESQGKLVEALKIYEEVYEAFSEFYGDEVDQSAHILFNIKSLRLKMAAGVGGAMLDLETILKIVDYGPTVFSIKYHWDDGRDTVLHRAVKTNNENIVRVVVEEIIAKSEGFDEQVAEFLNFENSELHTPLTLAVKYDCERAVKYLLEFGIPKGLDVNKITTSAFSASSLAHQRKNEEIKNMLIEHEAVLIGYRIAPI